MIRKQTKKGEIVYNMCKENVLMPSKTLAKIIYTKYPEMFKNTENVRSIIRSYRGTTGEKSRIAIKRNEVMKKQENTPYIAPSSITQKIEPYYLPINSRILFIPDIHFPYHDEKALELALNYGKLNKCNIIVMQESFDYYHNSRFEKNPQEISFKIQREMYIKFLEGLRKFFGKTVTIIEQRANHTDRWKKWLRDKTPELDGIEYFGLENVFKFDENKIVYVDTHIKAGKLNIVHGDEFKGSGGVYPAKYIYEKTKECTIFGHFHRTSEYTDISAFSRVDATCWSVGCLSTTQPDYMKYSKHNNGFAFITIDKEGFFKVNNMRIINGKIV